MVTLKQQLSDTSIAVRRQTWRRLNAAKLIPGETMDMILNRLLDAYEQRDGARQEGAQPSPDA